MEPDNKVDDQFESEDKILQLQQPCQQINIRIIEGKTRGHNIGSYIGYIISITSPQDLKVQRRYREFAALREVMQKRWPGCVIPVLPRKHISGSNSLKVVEQRVKYLTYFLNCVAKTNFLYNSQQFQLFLHTKDTDVQKTMKNIKKISFGQILSNYRTCFPEIKVDDSKQIIELYNQKVSPYGKLLKDSKIKMAGYKKQIRALALAKQSYIKKCKIMYNQTLPEYQVYLQGALNISDIQTIKIFSDQKNQALRCQISKIENQIKFNLYWLVYQIIRLEMAQSDAASQAIDGRLNLSRELTITSKKIQTNNQQIIDIQKKNFSIKSLFNKNSDKAIAELEAENIKLQHDKVALTQLIDFCTSIIVNKEIPTYKQKRQRIWQKVWKKIAFSQKQYSLNMLKMLEMISGQQKF